MTTTYEIKTYDDIRNNLRVRLMDIKSNAETLQNAVYEPVGCGLALVAYMELPDDIAKGGIANLPNNMMRFNGVDRDTIMEDAMKRSMETAAPRLCSIQEMLFGGAFGVEPENYLEGGEVPEDTLLVLATDGPLGASALLYPGMKEKIGELVGDYFVLPSSVHEVLILPDHGQVTPKELSRIVKEINENEVSPQDRLCNKVLRFRNDEQELTIAADADRRLDKER